MILLGMIADASFKFMLASRLMDREIFEARSMWSELDAFHIRIVHILRHGPALSTIYKHTL